MSRLYFLLLLCFFSTNTFAQVVQLSSIEKDKHLAKQALIIEDPNHKFDFTGIYNESVNGDFFKAEDDIPYMDFTNSTYWMKLNLINDSNQTQNFYVEVARPLTNIVNLYLLDGEGNLIEKYESGDELVFDERVYNDRRFIFPLSFSANEAYTIIVECSSDGEILKLPLKFWRIEAFTAFTTKENFFLGLYYGLFILVIILFSFFGLALRQNLYTYFVIYVFMLGLFQLSLDGLALQYLWPNWVWFGNHAILVLAAISMTFMLLYVKNFLDFKTKHPKYLKVYNGFIVLIFIALLTSLSWGALYEISFPLLNGLSFITILYILYGVILKFRTEDKPEFPLVMAFLALCLGSIFFILANVNIIQSEFLATNALKLGSAAEVIFLSIAMAGRYRKTQIEKMQAQKEAFKRLEEINELKSQQTEKLEKEVAERTQEIREKNDMLSTQNQEIINSINYAKRLQDAILPSDESLNQLLPEHGIVYLPKDIVSGDFYWIEHTDENVFFAVADCTGHGVPGAMVSVVGYNSLNRCVRELQLTDPAEILNHLTEMVEETFSKQYKTVSDGMDIALCVWNKKDLLTYAGAYNPLYLIRKGELIEIKADKQPIGKFIRREKFTSHQLKIQDNDSIYLFSDGYADQFGGEKGKKLKYSKFKEYLLELNDVDAHNMSEELIRRFHDWRGSNEQIDDVCLMKVRF